MLSTFKGKTTEMMGKNDPISKDAKDYDRIKNMRRPHHYDSLNMYFHPYQSNGLLGYADMMG